MHGRRGWARTWLPGDRSGAGRVRDLALGADAASKRVVAGAELPAQAI